MNILSFEKSIDSFTVDKREANTVGPTVLDDQMPLIRENPVCLR